MLVYLNAFSLLIVQLVEYIRETLGRGSIGITFDAGPHPVLFINPKYDSLICLFGSLFSSVEHNAKMTTFLQSHSLPLTAEYSAIEERAQCAILPSYVILSNPGSGPA